MGFIDTVANMTTFDKTYKDIIYNQLGNVLLVTDLDSANRISKKIGNRYKIVTIDGEIIHVGGSITGGNLNTGRSIISDKQELERLINKRKNDNDVVTELEDKIKDIDNEIKTYIDKKEKYQADYVIKNEVVNSKLNTLTGLKERLSTITSELNSLGHVVDSSLSKEIDATSTLTLFVNDIIVYLIPLIY